jgi:hypothetical protein
MIFYFNRLLAAVIIFTLTAACNKKVSEPGSHGKETSQHLADTSGLWKDLDIPPPTDTAGFRPVRFRLLSLNFEGMKKLLLTAPNENEKVSKKGVIVNMPMPDGSWQTFAVYETMVMSPELAARYPDIKTYSGNGYVDKTMSVRLDFSPNGFHAMMITLKGAVNLDPYSRQEKNKYICYFKHDVDPGERHRFEVDSLK